MNTGLGYEYFKSSPAGLALQAALAENANGVRQAADRGDPPLLVLAPMMQQYFIYPKIVRMSDRIVQEWLGPAYVMTGRQKAADSSLPATFQVYRRA
ncbi:hypothetical protein [Sandarakinorhabdus cyanobacteriorum]|uniref:hypothetical protein n=1 Tax=Sandarakinorhabdus cyanobacteriorum TaxID=1981098 RepID=UPI0010552ABA|nr:hypothetical protein [Sandarakinorhabdus cyanobacteriorum]